MAFAPSHDKKINTVLQAAGIIIRYGLKYLK